MRLSVAIITHNEEANIRRTLESVLPLVRDGRGEIIVVDSGSSDRTVEIARELGATVFVEPWKGFASQKNSAIAKAKGDWVLSLDADEELSAELTAELGRLFPTMERWNISGMPVDMDPESQRARDEGLAWGLDEKNIEAFNMPRVNYFLGRAIRHGGFYPDRKLRLFKRGAGRVKDVPVHEVIVVEGDILTLDGPILHHAYPTLSAYIEHMNRYSSLGAEIAASKGHRSFSFMNIVLRPIATFIQKYFLKLGFLDGREGLLLCLYHSVYVSWKYAKAWERSRSS